eukprot:Tamp_06009.p1 GENE.Tamp_06009~~Tamp_06009.p1  ORF type:complete len:805 (+),score=141.27 Tamp_06009:237-2417(+)
MGSGKTLASAFIDLEPLRRTGLVDTSVPLIKAGGQRMLGHDGLGTQLRVRLEAADPRSRSPSVLSAKSRDASALPLPSPGSKSHAQSLDRDPAASPPATAAAAASRSTGNVPAAGVTAATPSPDTTGATAAAGDKQRLLEGSDAVTRDLFQSALASGSAACAGARSAADSASAHASAGTWTLVVSRLSVAHLPKMDKMGKCDPYLKVSVGGYERKTTVKKNTYEGSWTEELELAVVSGVREAVVSVWDWDRLGKDELVGSVTVPLDHLIRGATREESLEMRVFKSTKPTPISPKAPVVGHDSFPTAVCLHVSVLDTARSSTSSLASALREGGAGGAGGAGGGRIFRLTVEEAVNLPKMDSLGKCDAYVLASLGKLVQKTNTIKNTYSPTFGETFEFTQQRAGEEVLFRIMDWHRMSKDTLVGAARLSLDSKINCNEVLKLAVLNAAGAPIKGHNGQPTLLTLHVQDMGVQGEEEAGANNSVDCAKPNETSTLEDVPSTEGPAKVKPSLFAAQHTPPRGSASVRMLSAAFEGNKAQEGNKTPSQQPQHRSPPNSAGDGTRWLEETTEGGGGLGAGRQTEMLQTAAQAHEESRLARKPDTATRPPLAPGSVGPPLVPALGLGALKERDSDGRPLALGKAAVTSPRSDSARSVGSRGSNRRRTPRSARTSPRFELKDGEDVSDAAQRMISTIRNRLASSRTPSEGSVRSMDDVPSPPSSHAGSEKLEFV